VDYAHFEALVKNVIRADLADLAPRIAVTRAPRRWFVTVVVPGRGAVRDFFTDGEFATHEDVMDFVGAVVEEVRTVLG
jgi:hypothetical protein